MKPGKKSFLKSAPALILIVIFLAILIAADIYFIASKKYTGHKAETQTSSSIQKNGK